MNTVEELILQIEEGAEFAKKQWGGFRDYAGTLQKAVGVLRTLYYCACDAPHTGRDGVCVGCNKPLAPHERQLIAQTQPKIFAGCECDMARATGVRCYPQCEEK
jgi:hypothetical protein